jgi:microcystin degradation protein MlrC
MRILVGAIGHESNTFTPFLTTRDDFHVLYGADILAADLGDSSLAGIIVTLRDRGATLVPTVAAGALPGGVVARAAYEELKEAVLRNAHDIDGVCLYLHGAMRAEGVDYAEDDLLRDLRAKLGPDIPISVALDMHANIMPEMARNADALVAYHTAPHDDEFETGVRAAEMLLTMLDEGIRPRIGFAKVPFLLPGEMAQTALEPMAGMMRLVGEIERRPGVLSASLANGHCWADVPDVGVAAIVVAREDAALAQALAEELAQAFWARRTEFGVSAEAYPLEEAITVSLSAPESPVFLSDSGDNPGAGGATDVPLLLERLLARRAANVLIAGLWDVEAVEACAAAGVGNVISLAVGGKLDTRHGRPLAVTGRVRLVSDGQIYRGAVRRDPGRARPGPVALLNVDGIDVILTSTRVSFEDPAQLRRLGLEPLDYRIVVLKRGYLTTPFQVMNPAGFRGSPRSILAFTPGATNCDLTQMEFRRLNRPVYPLDPSMSLKLQ